MIASMTGFGAAAVGAEGVIARVELRSTNHRHLQIKLRLPHDFAQLEAELEGRLRKRFSRGSMTAHLSVERPPRADAVQVDRELARRYHTLMQELAGDLGLDSAPSVAELVHLPGVLAGIEDAAPGEEEANLLRAAVDEAGKQLQAMRAAEGANLEANLREHGRAIRAVLERIEERMPQVVKHHHDSLRERVQELLGDSATLSSTDLARELAMLADRLDVREETDRLDSHLKQLEAQLDKGGAVGRQLDFLAQEFLREANTIGSKCSDAQVAHDVVELKTHIERLREQVQNVE